MIKHEWFKVKTPKIQPGGGGSRGGGGNGQGKGRGTAQKHLLSHK